MSLSGSLIFFSFLCYFLSFTFILPIFFSRILLLFSSLLFPFLLIVQTHLVVAVAILIPNHLPPPHLLHNFTKAILLNNDPHKHNKKLWNKKLNTNRALKADRHDSIDLRTCMKGGGSSKFFTLFSQSTIPYSYWLVILTPYNLSS